MYFLCLSQTEVIGKIDYGKYLFIYFTNASHSYLFVHLYLLMTYILYNLDFDVDVILVLFRGYYINKELYK